MIGFSLPGLIEYCPEPDGQKKGERVMGIMGPRARVADYTSPT